MPLDGTDGSFEVLGGLKPRFIDRIQEQPPAFPCSPPCFELFERSLLESILNICVQVFQAQEEGGLAFIPQAPCRFADLLGLSRPGLRKNDNSWPFEQFAPRNGLTIGGSWIKALTVFSDPVIPEDLEGPAQINKILSLQSGHGLRHSSSRGTPSSSPSFERNS